jgi:DNA modification methylase
MIRVETIGRATLYLGDCRDILPTLPKVDAVVTDPPYGVDRAKGMGGAGLDGSGRYARRPKQYVGGWDDERPTADDFGAILFRCEQAIIWGGNYFSDILPRGGRWLFWDKLNSMPSYSDGEIAWTNIKGVAVKKFTRCVNGMASHKDGPREHPTQKPIDLMEWCIGKMDGPRTILDPYMGTASTGVAAIRQGRNFIGIEREERYFEAACRRIREVSGEDIGPLFVEAA